MKHKFYYAILIDELVILGSDTEKPTIDGESNKDLAGWKDAFEEWLSCGTSYEISNTEHEKLFLQLALKDFKDFDCLKDKFGMSDKLKQGIKIPNENVECIGNGGLSGQMQVAYFVPYAPIKEEEPQHLIWNDVIKMIENNEASNLMKEFYVARK